MSKFKGSFAIFAILAFLLTLLAFKVYFLRANFQFVNNQTRWVEHTAEVINELELTISYVKDAESSVRGYAITKDGQFLTAYQDGIAKALERASNVENLVTDNPRQHNQALVLKELLKSRVEALDKILSQARAGRTADLAPEVFRGKMVMDRLRNHVNLMIEQEQELLKERSTVAESSRSVFYTLLYSSNSAIALVMLICFVVVARSQSRTLKDRENKDAMARLSTMIAGDLSLEEASQNVLSYLSNKMNVLAASLYVYDSKRLRLASSMGGSTETASQGLLESAIRRDAVSEIHEVPDDYWNLSSSLGSKRPTVISFMPFKFQGKSLGVIEIGSFTPLSENDKAQLALFEDIIGVGINSALTRTKLQELLETTQMQSEELQTQQEELRSNNEELEQQTRALESQQQALNVKNEELQGAQVELQKRAADLEQSTQYKSEFLAKMSHELRTPLNGLLILSTLLIENKDRNLSDQQIQFAKSINNAGNDLLTLINDILDLSKIEARKLSLRVENFTLRELFESTRQIFEPQAKLKSLDFKIVIPDEAAELTLKTDRQRLDQVIRNFISNALKFTDKGSITLRASKGPANRIQISVEDTGIGVSKDKQGLIFEAFEQADSSISRKFGGTGLGLTISRELANLLGGTITLKSEEGTGSAFTIEIPTVLPIKGEGSSTREDSNYALPMVPSQDRPDSDKQRLNALARALFKDIEESEKSILIVEDDEAFRLSVAAAARSYGFTPIEVGDGELALEILKNFTPTAVLLDIKLPGISGLGILEMIKQMPHLRHVPVHMISGLEYQQSALRMGALGYMTKPVTTDKVKSALSRIERLISSKVRKVLLIEDDEKQAFAVTNLIAGPDLEVISVNSGKNALEKLQSLAFDCVILDLSLPDMTGFDLLNQMDGLEISLPPIVIYTGKDLSEEEDRYLRKFSESIIIKGARSPERLLDEVNLFLHRVETQLPEATRSLLSDLRSREKAFDGKTVLVVDDDIRNIFALTSALESKGLLVEVARDGLEALEALDNKSEIKLVLMDIMMPKMDGFEAMRTIRKNENPRIKNVPIVALTAKAMREDHEKCIAAGANDYLPKPVNLENLTTILKVWLSPKGLFE